MIGEPVPMTRISREPPYPGETCGWCGSVISAEALILDKHDDSDAGRVYCSRKCLIAKRPDAVDP